jgi:hypothetical protein
VSLDVADATTMDFRRSKAVRIAGIIVDNAEFPSWNVNGPLQIAAFVA